MAVFQDGITEKFNLQLNLPVAQSSFNLGLSSWVELKVNIQEVSIAALQTSMLTLLQVLIHWCLLLILFPY